MRLHTIASICLTTVLSITAISLADTNSSSDTSAATPSISAPRFEDAENVGRLIQELGNPRYVARRMAEKQLLEIGMKAFDQIDASTQDSDPEIAASCKYLVSELTVRWTRRDDVPQVKSVLNGYANFDEARRLTIVQSISRQQNDWAISPLCRICRYDSSTKVSRQAAIELLSATELDLDYSTDVAKLLRQEVGTSVRPAATWIRLLAAQIEDPRSTLTAWPAEIESAVSSIDPEDAVLLKQVCELARNYARVALESRDADSYAKAVSRFLELTNDGKEQSIAGFLDWAVEAQAPELVAKVIEDQRELLTRSKAGLYLMAKTYYKQSNPELAEQLANQAFEIEGDYNNQASTDMRVLQARLLLAEGHIQWARRELKKAIEEGTVASAVQAEAVDLLSDSLHDWQEDKKASEVIESLVKQLRKEPTLAKQYDDNLRNARRLGKLLPSINQMESNQFFYEALALKMEKNREEEWKKLEKAYNLNQQNIDILIAMYRASGENQERRQQVMKMIHDRCRYLDQHINDHNGTSKDVNDWYNQWAWLVSNTEGDFEKAIRYSHKSIDNVTRDIERMPGRKIESTAGLLDTLGRCYFAAGQIDNAIKYQSQAVEYNPHLQTLKRQLDEFRQAKSAQQG